MMEEYLKIRPFRCYLDYIGNVTSIPSVAPDKNLSDCKKCVIFCFWTLLSICGQNTRL